MVINEYSVYHIVNSFIVLFVRVNRYYELRSWMFYMVITTRYTLITERWKYLYLSCVGYVLYNPWYMAER